MVFTSAEIPKPSIDDFVQNWNAQQANFKKLSAKEKEFYYWVNYSRSNPERFFEKAVLPLVKLYPQLKGGNLESLENELHNVNSLPLLFLNDTLINTSKAHSIDITSHNANPSHNSTNGDSFADRFKKAKLSNCGSENISFSGGVGDPLFALVILYLDIDVPGLGHRKTLLSSAYASTGIGISEYKNGNTFIVEDFACPQN